MACDVSTRFYGALNSPLQERVAEISVLIDTCSLKDLQSIFPQLINSIFGGGTSCGWGVRMVNSDSNIYEFELLHSFLAPQGPMFRLCYKLLSDGHLKYSLPLHLLPMDLCQMLESGRYSQFYADLLNVDTQSLNMASLALNPFDLYIFQFALHLHGTVTKYTWESLNTVYFLLACDYLTHFLPTDTTVAVSPHLPYFSGKAPAITPLQITNRPSHVSSLLIQDLAGMIGQEMNVPQMEPRNEIWRSETVLQVFIDVWLSVADYHQQTYNSFPSDGCSPTLTRPSVMPATAGERVRVARILVKQIHSFASRSVADPLPRSASLRRCARQLLRIRAYRYISSLIKFWPLDASFRLALELWLSYIQPWRYSAQESYEGENLHSPRMSEDHRLSKSVSTSYMQFIAENLPVYTTILLQILPRFLRLDLTAPKNAIMLYRLGKVFSQPNLIPMLMDIEQSAISRLDSSVERPFQDSYLSYSPHSSMEANSRSRWYGVAKQAILELSNNQNEPYQALWSDTSKQLVAVLLKKIGQAKQAAESIVTALELKLQQQNDKGFLNMLKFWKSSTSNDDDFTPEERKKVPTYLGLASEQFSQIFGFENSITEVDNTIEESNRDQSASSSYTHPLLSPRQSRLRTSEIKYMGDPDLSPIETHENMFLVRVLYQITLRMNEMYGDNMWEFWNRRDFLGDIAREVLLEPRVIQNYMRGSSCYKTIETQVLPPRISLRPLASHVFLIWFAAGYFLFWALGCSSLLIYVLSLILFCSVYTIGKASLRRISILPPRVMPTSDVS